MMMSKLELPVVARVNLFIHGVRAFDPLAPDAIADPTTLPVYVALAALDVTADTGDWVAATWVNPTTVRIMVSGSTLGGGAIDKGVGAYMAWLRVDGATESPRWPVGRVNVVAV